MRIVSESVGVDNLKLVACLRTIYDEVPQTDDFQRSTEIRSIHGLSNCGTLARSASAGSTKNRTVE